MAENEKFPGLREVAETVGARPIELYRLFERGRIPPGTVVGGKRGWNAGEIEQIRQTVEKQKRP